MKIIAISCQYSKREKQAILLLLTGHEKWHYLTVAKLSALLSNCLHSFRTKTKLKSHEKVCKNHDFFDVIMSNERNKTLKHTQHLKSIRAPFLIYADIESFL